MGKSVDRYGQQTLDFVERVQSLTDYQEICMEIVSELETFGFSCITCGTLPAPGVDPLESVLMNTRPADYVEHYIEKDLLVRDPVMNELRRTTSRYTWDQLRDRGDLKKLEREIMDEAREFDVKTGLVIPIFTLSGSISIFSACGLGPDLSARAQSAVEIIGIYSYQLLKRALVSGRRDSVAHKPLTAREREVLQWVAAGKSDDEISEILTISMATVTSHVENAKLKLDAFKRTFAVVQALRFGEISL